MFDINDFDETLPGPWEWDVKRLAASLEIARARPRVLRRRAPDRGRRRRRRVPDRMRQLAEMRNLDVWYAHIEVDELLERVRGQRHARSSARRPRPTVAKARTRDSMQAFSKLTHEVDGDRRIVADPPLIVPIEDCSRRTQGAMTWRASSAP